MFIFADESESRQTVDASTEILSSTFEFPSRASCQSKSSEVDYSGIDILDTLIIERLTESTFENSAVQGMMTYCYQAHHRHLDFGVRGCWSKFKGSDPVFDKQEYYRLT